MTVWVGRRGLRGGRLDVEDFILRAGVFGSISGVNLAVAFGVGVRACDVGSRSMCHICG